MTLIADEGLTCLSNMDFKSEDSIKSADGKHKKAVTFNTTPPMSSYLLAVAVGEFDFVESKDFRIPVKVVISGQANGDDAYEVLGLLDARC